MLLRVLLAFAHLLALGVGLGAVWVRARALSGPLDRAGLRRAFAADAAWGLAALLWISTGLVRAFGGFEKGSAYYLHNDFFLLKMAALALILVLEVWPAVTLVRWRAADRRGEMPPADAAQRLAAISYVQAGLVVAMVLAATAMARGLGV